VLGRILQNSPDLFEPHAWEQISEFLYGHAVLQILKKSRQWDARTRKDERPADLVCRALNFGAVGLIDHLETLTLRAR
jgi:hypothetical protein